MVCQTQGLRVNPHALIFLGEVAVKSKLLNLGCCAGKGVELMGIDDEPATKQHTRDPLSVKLKPKRGQSSRKQKQRLAIKLDKVRL